MSEGLHEFNGAFLVILNKAGDILLEMDNRKEPKYNLPGGGMGMGELAIDAAVREAYEETGLQIYRGNLKWVGHFVLRKKYGDVFLYEYQVPIENLPEHVSNEVSSFAFMSIEGATNLGDQAIYPAQRALIRHYENWVRGGRTSVVQDFLSPPFETM